MALWGSGRPWAQPGGRCWDSSHCSLSLSHPAARCAAAPRSSTVMRHLGATDLGLIPGKPGTSLPVPKSAISGVGKVACSAGHLMTIELCQGSKGAVQGPPFDLPESASSVMPGGFGHVPHPHSAHRPHRPLAGSPSPLGGLAQQVAGSLAFVLRSALCGQCICLPTPS